MHVTVTCDLTGASVFPVEVDGSMEMENFLVVCQLEIPALKDIPMSQLNITHNGRVTVMNAENLKKTINVSSVRSVSVTNLNLGT
ncbi:unnamed protein product [Gongylonema pulchrum]|uniref:Recep_L_domain domain-containing protein n=1 Tax=Gongylonema pulchrum TaxID=637853 RepID=A0A183DUR4_9BILA|nr:unnamed protein product [Gongylonema pulchrum]